MKQRWAHVRLPRCMRPNKLWNWGQVEITQKSLLNEGQLMENGSLFAPMTIGRDQQTVASGQPNVFGSVKHYAQADWSSPNTHDAVQIGSIIQTMSGQSVDAASQR